MERIRYENYSTDAYSGQVNMTALLYVGEDVVAGADYVLYDGELTISDIMVKHEHRRMGYGSRLIKFIKEQNPEYVYKPSLKTEDGAKFVHKDLPLYEKFKAKRVLEFHKTGDPLSALNLGIIQKRDFKDIPEFIDWLIAIVPNILGTKEIPKNIIYDQRGYYVRYEYAKAYDLFLEGKEFTIGGKKATLHPNSGVFYFPNDKEYIPEIWLFMKKRLKDMGFKTYEPTP